MLSFTVAFPLSSFTLIKSLFSSSLFPAIRVVSSAYLYKKKEKILMTQITMMMWSLT